MIIDGETRCGICGVLGSHTQLTEKEATVASSIAHRLFAQLKDRLSEEERRQWDRDHIEFLEFEVWLHYKSGATENDEEMVKREGQIDKFVLKGYAEAAKCSEKEVPMR